MIQRKQTIFLLLAVALTVILFFAPIAVLKVNGQDFIFKISGIKSMSPNSNFGVSTMPFLILLALAGAISFFAIFLFKNRPFQARLCVLNMVLTAVISGLICFQLFSSMATEVSVVYGLFLPLFMLIFQFLAYRGIRKDDKLVKSLDRIR